MHASPSLRILMHALWRVLCRKAQMPMRTLLTCRLPGLTPPQRSIPFASTIHSLGRATQTAAAAAECLRRCAATNLRNLLRRSKSPCKSALFHSKGCCSRPDGPPLCLPSASRWVQLTRCTTADCTKITRQPLRPLKQ